ncbi:hypothetical protein [Paraburkholderia sp. Ac-20347]|jgi:hypothetical protein|uniref:hypothetical protein n=1 Tax=Paraburkholderia sp. Ac-20347 TaxID=2703892 RepID=UPI00197F90A1|nr:hypothetical protein [Paraburkholderia sp. Ac-20347]MBN3811898.1 hypothetical protein [Paraburkholderia sp. Ac-20347]
MKREGPEPQAVMCSVSAFANFIAATIDLRFELPAHLPDNRGDATTVVNSDSGSRTWNACAMIGNTTARSTRKRRYERRCV